MKHPWKASLFTSNKSRNLTWCNRYWCNIKIHWVWQDFGWFPDKTGEIQHWLEHNCLSIHNSAGDNGRQRPPTKQWTPPLFLSTSPSLPPFCLVNPAVRWRRSEVSRPRRVTPRFPSIIHRAAAASAPVFNSPDDHIIPPPKRDRQGRGRGRRGWLARGRKRFQMRQKEEKEEKTQIFVVANVFSLSLLAASAHAYPSGCLQIQDLITNALWGLLERYCSNLLRHPFRISTKHHAQMWLWVFISCLTAFTSLGKTSHQRLMDGPQPDASIAAWRSTYLCLLFTFSTNIMHNISVSSWNMDCCFHNLHVCDVFRVVF